MRVTRADSIPSTSLAPARIQNRSEEQGYSALYNDCRNNMARALDEDSRPADTYSRSSLTAAAPAQCRIRVELQPATRRPLRASLRLCVFRTPKGPHETRCSASCNCSDHFSMSVRAESPTLAVYQVMSTLFGDHLDLLTNVAFDRSLSAHARGRLVGKWPRGRDSTARRGYARGRDRTLVQSADWNRDTRTNRARPGPSTVLVLRPHPEG
jgi:hypothetical protein